MRIIFVSEYFYPRKAGGEIWSWELCSGLVKKGHKVTVLTTQFDNSPQKETVKGVKILRLVKTTRNEQNRVVRKISLERFIRQVKLYMQKNIKSVDIIHTIAYNTNVPISEFAKKHKIPCITSVHSYFGKNWKLFLPIKVYVQYLEKKHLKKDKSSFIHVPSEYLRRQIKKDTGKDSIVIHNWLPEHFPTPKKLHNTILFVGSLEEIKNPLACIDVAKRLKKELLVIGTGSLKNKMEKKAKEAHIKCTFLGTLSSDETLSYIGGTSLLLVPSITESFSLAALEAVAQGTPVSGTPVGIIPELPHVKFPPKNLPKRVSKNIQKKIREQHTKEHAIEQFEDLYKRIL